MWIENLRSAFRGLRSAPGFTITAIVSLSLGIGGSVAMFTVVNSVLLKPLAYQDAGRLVRVSNAYTRSDSPDLGVLPLQFTRWRGQIQSLESIALAANGTNTLPSNTDNILYGFPIFIVVLLFLVPFFIKYLTK